MEMARIVHDVRTVEPPQLPPELTDAGKSVGQDVSPQNLGALGVIADRMYGLLPPTERDQAAKDIVTEAYAAWMVAVSAIDDVIDETPVTLEQKGEYLQLGRQAFLDGQVPEGGASDPALDLPLGLFAHAGELMTANSNGQRRLEQPMVELTELVARQDYTEEEAEQQEIAALVGGMCIAAPVLFAESLNDQSYPQEFAAAMALGSWAQKLDNVRDMKFDEQVGQTTAEVVRLSAGEPAWRVAASSLSSARQELRSATAGLNREQKRVINAMANLMFIRYFVIHPAKTFVECGKLTMPPTLELQQQSA